MVLPPRLTGRNRPGGGADVTAILFDPRPLAGGPSIYHILPANVVAPGRCIHLDVREADGIAASRQKSAPPHADEVIE
jgi:hypothetical protein